MLTDKQSIIICAVIIFGFVLSGLLDILDNYVVVGVLVICFLVVIVNIFSNKKFMDTEDNQETKN